MTDPVLVVDLDRALVRRESLRETLFALVAATPLAKLGTSAAFLRPSPPSENETACPPAPAPTELLCDEAVLDQVRVARAKGTRTVLISTASQEHVAAVAEHLGLFDDAIGLSEPASDSLSAPSTPRADALEVRYGAVGYDYIGNQIDDLNVWMRARRAFVARPSREVKTAAEEQGISLASVNENTWSIWPLIRAMRPHQWSKNVLILLPIIASHNLGAIGAALLAMVAFSLVASSVYIVNDLVDLQSDRAHPRKRRRPFASGEAQISHGLVVAALLIAAAIGLSLAFLPAKFIAVLLLYLAATVAYTFWLKRKLLVDIIALAGLYTARILAGGAATGIALSPWLLAFSMFLFFSLAAIKRQAELIDQERAGKTAALGRAYFTDDLPIVRIMAVTSGQAAVLVLALYLNNPATVGLYAQPYVMWLLCPILFYWLGRMELMTHRGYMDDDPIVFACRDGISLLCLLTSAVVVMTAVIGY